MIVFFSPFKYLSLRNERGSRLFFRDIAPIIILTTIFALPFLAFEQVNFSRPSGFVEKIGSLTSVLAGFYIAALVAVASFAASVGDMDEEIKVGKIFTPDNKEHSLSRREYVCAIFGFLAFLSLAISILSAFSLIISPIIPSEAVTLQSIFMGYNINLIWWLRAACVVAYCLFFSMMVVTTFYGLYYLTDRIYAKSPVILPKPKEETKRDL